MTNNQKKVQKGGGVPITFHKDERGVAAITLNRPDVHNAFDDVLIADLIEILDKIQADNSIRAVVLRAAGKSFSAGADLRWMRRMADYNQEENKADSMQLAALMKKLNTLNKPTIARVQGAAFGGGVGLVACCDMVVASTKALFCLSEVRLGLLPAVISPYVVAAMTEAAARRYFLTAERFSAEQALEHGLVHEVVDESELDNSVEALIGHLLNGGPEAIAHSKDLIFAVSRKHTTDEVIEDTANRIAARRASDEGKEGLNAFLEKRAANWVQE